MGERDPEHGGASPSGAELEGVRDALQAVQRVGDDAPGPHHVVGVGRRRRAGWCPRPRWCGSWRTCGVTSWDPRSSTIAASNRSSRSATGSSLTVMPATATGPGMTMTWSASYDSSWACHNESERHQRRTSASITGTKFTGLPGRRQTSMKKGTSAGCRTAGGGLGVRRDQLVDRRGRRVAPRRGRTARSDRTPPGARGPPRGRASARSARARCRASRGRGCWSRPGRGRSPAALPARGSGAASCS